MSTEQTAEVYAAPKDGLTPGVGEGEERGRGVDGIGYFFVDLTRKLGPPKEFGF